MIRVMSLSFGEGMESSVSMESAGPGLLTMVYFLKTNDTKYCMMI